MKTPSSVRATSSPAPSIARWLSGRGAFLDCRTLGPEARRAFSRPCSPPAVRPASTRARADPGRAGGALPHGRHPHRCARAQHGRRAVGLRRGRLDRRAWREPACLQLAARGRGVRRARGARYRRVLADRPRRSSRRDSPGGRRSHPRRDRRPSTSFGTTMTADVGVIRDAELARQRARRRSARWSETRTATGASATCCRPPN